LRREFLDHNDWKLIWKGSLFPLLVRRRERDETLSATGCQGTYAMQAISGDTPPSFSSRLYKKRKKWGRRLLLKRSSISVLKSLFRPKT
jgi:hypothetical protein